MPLLPGKKNIGRNVEHEMNKYKRTGTLNRGRIHPRNRAHARRIALAIAYNEAKGGHH
ncbi:MAG: hypothetical protein ACWGQW_04785 [bacterium]